MISMRYIIIYDITDDNLRDAIAKKLLDYGLKRIQYSSFIGNLPRFMLHSLTIDLNHIIFRDSEDGGGKEESVKEDDGKDRRSIIIYPLCDSCYSKGITIDKVRGKGIRYLCDKASNNSKHDDWTVVV